MKIVFFVVYPGYLRYFDSVLETLEARGHSITLVFSKTGRQNEGLEVLAARDSRIVVWPNDVIRRRDAWARFACRLQDLMDAARYLDWSFAKAPYLRQRAEGALPKPFAFLAKWPHLPGPVVRLALRLLLWLQDGIPSSGDVEVFLKNFEPDLVLVTPLVTDGNPQVDVVKSAKALGVPVGLCVASWDHLTTKGLMKERPDIAFVWNDIQKREARRLHMYPGHRVVVTGAQPFDRWFDRTPRKTRSQFCRDVGVPEDKPIILFVGSTKSISAPTAEIDFVRRWIAAVRRDGDARLRTATVMIRPHPYNYDHWPDVDLSDFGSVVVWPRTAPNPVDENDRAEYFDTLSHSAAIVGINTSAMVEATIVGRPILSILADSFSATQEGTLHFRYLLPEHGGFLKVARTLSEHLAHLREAVTDPAWHAERQRRFVSTFVRPHGLDQDATARLADGIEALGTLGIDPQRHVSMMQRLARRIAAPLADRVRREGRRSGMPLYRKAKPGKKTKPLRVTETQEPTRR